MASLLPQARRGRCGLWRQRLEHARRAICARDRVLCGILLGLKPLAAEGLGTLGVDRSGVLVLDPCTVSKIDYHELVRILVHEALHVLFSHPQRCERLVDHETCNIAADAIVEHAIDEARPQLVYARTGERLAPKPGSEYSRGLAVLRSILESCGVTWDDVSRYTLEKLYSIIASCRQGRGGAGSGGRALIDVHEWAPTTRRGAGQQLDRIARTALDMARRADPRFDAVAGKLPGIVPGELEEALDFTGLRPRPDWRQLVRQYIDAVVPHDYDWRRPSRRSQALGAHLPGSLRRGYKIVVLVDTSASVSEEEYREFAETLYGILLDKPVETVVVAQADVEVRDEKVFHGAPPPQRLLEALSRRKGFGGTSLEKPLQEMLEKHPDAALFIYLTDGYGEKPERFPKPILWLISSQGAEPGSEWWPRVGKAVRIKPRRVGA